MQKQLIKIGSSLGIIIDKPILVDRLILRPLRFDAARAAYGRFAGRHRRSLKKLAE